MSAPAIAMKHAGAEDHSPRLLDGHASDFVIQMAHDLRSPLSSILVLAEAMQAGRGGPVTDVQKRQLGLIYSAALSLCAAANDMVEMARAGTDLLHERPAPFSVSAVLDSVRDIVRPMVHERNVELRIVGPAFDRRRGRSGLLARVLLNLATNALKSTDEGCVEIAVREVAGDVRRVECSVHDTGCGLDPSVLRSLFARPGGSSAAVREQLTSAGLGLGMCRRMVSALSSTLCVETRSRVGTRFSFEVALPPVAMDA